jgi:hypothetical protein
MPYLHLDLRGTSPVEANTNWQHGLASCTRKSLRPSRGDRMSGSPRSARTIFNKGEEHEHKYE